MFIFGFRGILVRRKEYFFVIVIVLVFGKVFGFNISLGLSVLKSFILVVGWLDWEENKSIKIVFIIDKEFLKIVNLERLY